MLNLTVWADILQRQSALRRSVFARNIGSVMAYTAVGQSVYLLTGPLIGRLFSPVQFGLYGLFYSFTVLAMGLIFLNYDFAIPAADSDEDARKLTIGAAAIALICAPIAGGVMTLLSWMRIAGFGDLPAMAGILVVLLLLGQAGVQLLQNWCIRDGETVVIGKASVVLNVVRGATQILLGAFTPFWWALGAGEVSGRVGNALHLGRGRKVRDALREVTAYRPREIWSTLRTYRQFPLVLLPSQAIDITASFMQSAGLAYFFGPAGLGIYFLMRRTLDLPVAFAFRSLSDVFYARQARDAREAPERVRPFFVRSVLLLAGGGFLVGIPAMLVSPALFALIFGPEWREAGVLAAIMAPASIMNLAVAPVARVFALTTRPQLRLCFSLVNIVGTLLTLALIAIASLDLRQTTIAISAVTFLAYLAYFIAGYVASASLRPPAGQSALEQH